MAKHLQRTIFQGGTNKNICIFFSLYASHIEHILIHQNMERVSIYAWTNIDRLFSL